MGANMLIDTVRRSEIEEMREWLKDCYEDEASHEMIDECSDTVIWREVQIRYNGGVKQFLKDSGV